MSGRLHVLLIVLAIARPLAAQTSPAQEAQAAPPVDFLTRYSFHLAAARLATDDPRSNWEASVGGDLDLVDFGVGRINFLAEYETLLGNEFRGFDANQSRYTLEFFGAGRVAGNEVGVVFHHVSRHFVDRAKRFPIDWNMTGVAFRREFGSPQLRVVATARTMWAVQRSFVDYENESRGRLGWQYTLNRRWALTGGASLIVMTVDPAVFERGRLTGGLWEGGFRAVGRAGAVELFVAYERRIDGHPLDLGERNWAMVGFRFLNR